ncbi:MAG: GNAT family N-acetyltransferase, partial [Desulfohalobiaceae bacterium]|nr:GNAT family N-acetyltransferase [Desulfohalobiaceae bacterium]
MIHHEIRIREAQETDVSVLADFNRRMARETEDRELDPAVLTSGVQAVFTEPGRGFYLVAEITAAVVGCLLVTKEWSDWRDGEFWWIQSVYVARDFRGRGVF